jgi:hypothetical protein
VNSFSEFGLPRKKTTLRERLKIEISVHRRPQTGSSLIVSTRTVSPDANRPLGDDGEGTHQIVFVHSWEKLTPRQSRRPSPSNFQTSCPAMPGDARRRRCCPGQRNSKEKSGFQGIDKPFWRGQCFCQFVLFPCLP